MRSILGQMNEQDRFNILMFSNGVNRWKEGSLVATEENKEEAKAFVDASSASGGV